MAAVFDRRHFDFTIAHRAPLQSIRLNMYRREIKPLRLAGAAKDMIDWILKP